MLGGALKVGDKIKWKGLWVMTDDPPICEIVRIEGGYWAKTLSGHKFEHNQGEFLVYDLYWKEIEEENLPKQLYGCSCVSCGEYNEYATPNLDNNKFKCYSCRNYS